MPQTMPLVDVRRNLTRLPEQLADAPETGAVAVTRRGKPVLAVMSWEHTTKPFWKPWKCLARHPYVRAGGIPEGPTGLSTASLRPVPGHIRRKNTLTSQIFPP